MVDANAAYTLDDAARLAELDRFDLTMIEQPLDYDDIRDHAALQRRLRTAICLDESIHTVKAAAEALEIGACRVINIKPGRVLFELSYPDEKTAREALTRAIHKLPMKCRIVKREEF